MRAVRPCLREAQPRLTVRCAESAVAPPLLRIGNDTADLVIHARYVMTVDASDTLKENHAVVVEGGAIKAILPSDEARSVYRGVWAQPRARGERSSRSGASLHSPRPSPAHGTAAKVVERPSHVLMPGMVNAHTHAAMNNMRGVADDLPLLDVRGPVPPRPTSSAHARRPRHAPLGPDPVAYAAHLADGGQVHGQGLHSRWVICALTLCVRRGQRARRFQPP